MTMLDSMRRHKGILKWSLLVVAMAFVFFYVPSFMRTPGAADDVIATVEGRPVKAGDFRTMYQHQVDQFRSQYGAAMNDEMIKQLGLAQRLMQQMVDGEAVLAEADRQGITVTDGELSARLLRMPMLQENGQFVGEARYKEFLAMQRPPLRPAEFEEQLRRSLIAEKLQAAIAGWVRVSDAEVEQEYHKRNEKVKLELAVFTASNFRNGITPTDAEIAAEFAAHPDTFTMPEKRRVRFLSIDAQSLARNASVTDAEVLARYTQNQPQYSTPEQIRASHILFKTEGKDDATVKKLAESVLVKAKAPGADFAALAKQYSDDDTKTKGGDLDYFGHGTMVKEFDDAAWKLKPGEVSDLVKTQFGYHIIKFVDKRAAATKSLAEVKMQIQDQIRNEKAQTEAGKLADTIAPQIKQPADLDSVAKAHGLTVGDSGLFARDEPMAGLGFAQAVAAEAFTMQPNTVSAAIRTDQGVVFIALAEVKPPYVPKLDEVKAKVRDEVIRLKALDLAKVKAATVSQAGAKGNFAAAAKAAGVDIKTTDMIARNSALPEVGTSSAVDDAAFALPKGGVTAPVTTDTAIVVAHVVDKQDVTPASFEAERDTLRDQLLQQKRQDFFGAYMTKAKLKMKITYNDDTIRTLLGG